MTLLKARVKSGQISWRFYSRPVSHQTLSCKHVYGCCC